MFPSVVPLHRTASYALLTRPPLIKGASSFSPFDLHVLGTPPAFVLSQDQTLRLILDRNSLSFTGSAFFQAGFFSFLPLFICHGACRRRFRYPGLARNRRYITLPLGVCQPLFSSFFIFFSIFFPSWFFLLSPCPTATVFKQQKRELPLSFQTCKT